VHPQGALVDPLGALGVLLRPARALASAVKESCASARGKEKDFSSSLSSEFLRGKKVFRALLVFSTSFFSSYDEATHLPLIVFRCFTFRTLSFLPFWYVAFSFSVSISRKR
jgi:hypothetical protein